MKKDIVKIILETLSEDGFFNNEWIDENKFRPRFINSASKINFTDDLGKDMETLFNLSEAIAKSIIQENVDSTMKDLIGKGLVKEVTTKEGVTGYKLNNDYKNE